MKFVNRRTLRICLSIMALLVCGIAIGQLYAGRAGQEWPVYGHDAGGMRYSPLKQINRTNVELLQRD